MPDPTLGEGNHFRWYRFALRAVARTRGPKVARLGASKDLTGPGGRTARMYAEEGGYEKVAELF